MADPKIRERGSKYDPSQYYGFNEPNLFSLKINHGGVFVKHPVRRYVEGKVDYVDMLDKDLFSVIEFDEIIQMIGYPKEQIMFYHFLIPETELTTGLRPLGNDQDTISMLQYVPRFRVIEVFTEQWSSRLGPGYHFKSPVKNNSVVIEELDDPDPVIPVVSSRTKLKPRRKALALEWDNFHVENVGDSTTYAKEGNLDENVGDSATFEKEGNPDEVVGDSTAFENENQDEEHVGDITAFKNENQEEEDRMDDIENVNVEPTVEMGSFKPYTNEDGDDIAADSEEFEEAFDGDDGNVFNEALSKYRKMKKRSKTVEESPFFTGQSFPHKDAIMELVRRIAVKTKRQLHVDRNEKNRFRVVCYGINPDFVCGGSLEKNTKNECQKNSKKSRITPSCPWVLYLSRNTDDNPWVVKTLNERGMLWKCASATTMEQFNNNMEEIRKSDPTLHKWLQGIEAKHWARSHFSGRAKTDVLLNNYCEVFNRQLVGGRDKPIITCLEYIREYLMRRISVVNRLTKKCDGPLTPTATKTFNNIKEEASQYTVTFDGVNQYEVKGPWDNRRVVNIATRSCSCRKWELTGMPCKHVVAVIWDMIRHGDNVGLPESWVDKVYWLDTWRKVYQHTILPCNSKDMWIQSNCPTTLVPPKHHVQIGRPKKARKKSADELSQKMDIGGKLTREGVSISCGICKEKGHNRRKCPKAGSS